MAQMLWMVKSPLQYNNAAQIPLQVFAPVSLAEGANRLSAKTIVSIFWLVLVDGLIHIVKTRRKPCAKT